MKFSYTALTGKGEKATGVLDADNPEAVKEELHKMGLSILSLEAMSDADFEAMQSKEDEHRRAAGIITFPFQAVDKSGKTVEGTIDAVNGYAAFKRLTREYGFQVSSLESASAEMLKNWAQELKNEKEEPAAKSAAATELESTGPADPKIVAAADSLIGEAKKMLEGEKTRLPSALVTEAETIVGELVRIRTSNNVKHITEVANRLYKILSGTPVFSGKTAALGENPLIRREFELYEKAAGAKTAALWQKWIQKFKNLRQKKPSVQTLLPAAAPPSAASSRDYAWLFEEINSFLGWLLFSYLVYFYLADISIEKGLGLPETFVLRTLQSPLLFNIAVFLLLAHLAVMAKNRFFRKNALGSAALFSGTLILYGALVGNF